MLKILKDKRGYMSMQFFAIYVILMVIFFTGFKYTMNVYLINSHADAKFINQIDQVSFTESSYPLIKSDWQSYRGVFEKYYTTGYSSVRPGVPTKRIKVKTKSENWSTITKPFGTQLNPSDGLTYYTMIVGLTTRNWGNFDEFKFVGFNSAIKVYRGNVIDSTKEITVVKSADGRYKFTSDTLTPTNITIASLTTFTGSELLWLKDVNVEVELLESINGREKITNKTDMKIVPNSVSKEIEEL